MMLGSDINHDKKMKQDSKNGGADENYYFKYGSQGIPL